MEHLPAVAEPSASVSWCSLSTGDLYPCVSDVCRVCVVAMT
jgi:hypothetical protein